MDESLEIRLCMYCQTGPTGIDGHARLNGHSVELKDPPRTRWVYMCEGCGSMWQREYDGGGRFVWQLAPVLGN
jgi:hypothetical protein